MILIYAVALISLVFVGYLVREFYNEQLRERMVPVRAKWIGIVRRLRRG